MCNPREGCTLETEKHRLREQPAAADSSHPLSLNPTVQPPVQADDGDSLPSPPPSRNTSSLETARYSCRRTQRRGKQRFLMRDLWPEAWRVSSGPPTSHLQHRKEGVQGKLSPFYSKGIPWETSVRRLNYRHRCVEKCHLLQDRDEE